MTTQERVTSLASIEQSVPTEIKKTIDTSLQQLINILKTKPSLSRNLQQAFQGVLPSRDGSWEYIPEDHLFHPEDIVSNGKEHGYIKEDEVVRADAFSKLFTQVESDGRPLTTLELKSLFLEYSQTEDYLGRQTGLGQEAVAGHILSRENILAHDEIIQFLCGAMARRYADKLSSPTETADVAHYRKAYEFWRANYNQLNRINK